MDHVDEAAAGRELEDAIGEVLKRYAETVTGVRRRAAPGTSPAAGSTASRCT